MLSYKSTTIYVAQELVIISSIFKSSQIAPSSSSLEARLSPSNDVETKMRAFPLRELGTNSRFVPPKLGRHLFHLVLFTTPVGVRSSDPERKEPYNSSSVGLACEVHLPFVHWH